jgi:hypothetical protein
VASGYASPDVGSEDDEDPAQGAGGTAAGPEASGTGNTESGSVGASKQDVAELKSWLQVVAGKVLQLEGLIGDISVKVSTSGAAAPTPAGGSSVEAGEAVPGGNAGDSEFASRVAALEKGLAELAESLQVGVACARGSAAREVLPLDPH